MSTKAHPTQHAHDPIAQRAERGVEPKPDSPIVFGGCDYLALSRHPRLIAAAQHAAAQYGLSTSASRSTTGDSPVHRALETELAAFMDRQAAALVPEGFLANIAACQTLAARGIETVLIDENAHRSIHDAAALAGFRPILYPHRDAAAARNLAQKAGQPVAILTDSVFTATGAIAPIPDLLAALPTPDSVLVLDDCHGLAVLGTGRGSLIENNITDPRVWLTTTLAKGTGANGGALLATNDVIQCARTHATAFVCTTPTSPALVAAAREALRVIAAEPGRVERMIANTRRTADILRAAGYNAHNQPIPIFAFVPHRDPAESQRVLADHGVSIPHMRYPGGPAESYFRLSVHTNHTKADLDRLEQAIKAMG